MLIASAKSKDISHFYGKFAMSLTTLAAWWGAILSTGGFLWDIYKYRRAGPKLRFHVRNGKRLLQIEVINYGERPTTLTNVTLYYFEKLWSLSRLRNRPTTAAVLLFLAETQPFPCELKAGAIWRGHTEQVPEIEKWATKGVLYCDLHHSHREKPIRQRVVL
jgi:hypothetical protein